MKLKINSRYQWGSTKKLLINVHGLKTWRITTPLSSKSTFSIKLFFYNPELDAKILYEIVMEVQKYSEDIFFYIMVQNIWYKTRQIPYINIKNQKHQCRNVSLQIWPTHSAIYLPLPLQAVVRLLPHSDTISAALTEQKIASLVPH